MINLSIVLFAVVIAIASAATITVPCCDISAVNTAIANAAPNDTIMLSAGIYQCASGGIRVTKDVNIVGGDDVEINCGNVTYSIAIDVGTIHYFQLSGISIVNASTGINFENNTCGNPATAVLSRLHLHACNRGIYADATDIYLGNSEIDACTAHGVEFNSQTYCINREIPSRVLEVVHCSIHDNVDMYNSESGAGIYGYESTVIIRDTEMYNNYLQDGVNLMNPRGGALCVEGSQNGALHMYNVTVHDNYAYSGAGVYSENIANVTIDRCEFYNNHGVEYSAVYMLKSGDVIEPYHPVSLSISDCDFRDNYGPGDGNALTLNYHNSFDSHTVSLIRCSFTNNNSTNGGAVLFSTSYDTTAMITGCTFANNSASVRGGALHNVASNITMTNALFSNNRASDLGGAIGATNGHIRVVTSTFIDNSNYAIAAWDQDDHDYTVKVYIDCATVFSQNTPANYQGIIEGCHATGAGMSLMSTVVPMIIAVVMMMLV